MDETNFGARAGDFFPDTRAGVEHGGKGVNARHDFVRRVGFGANAGDLALAGGRCQWRASTNLYSLHHQDHSPPRHLRARSHPPHKRTKFRSPVIRQFLRT